VLPEETLEGGKAEECHDREPNEPCGWSEPTLVRGEDGNCKTRFSNVAKPSQVEDGLEESRAPEKEGHAAVMEHGHRCMEGSRLEVKPVAAADTSRQYLLK